MKINLEVLKEKSKKIISQFDRNAGIFLALLLIILYFCIVKLIMPGFTNLISNSKDFMNKKEAAINMQKKLEFQQQLQRKKILTKEELPIEIYKTPYKDMELENAAAEFVNEIISIVKKNGPTKILTINFEKNPLKDNMGIESKNHSVLSLQLEMESSYDTIQNILNEIYLMNYLIKIKTVSLTSLQKYNYKKMQTYIILDLFIDVS